MSLSLPRPPTFFHGPWSSHVPKTTTSQVTNTMNGFPLHKNLLSTHGVTSSCWPGQDDHLSIPYEGFHVHLQLGSSETKLISFGRTWWPRLAPQHHHPVSSTSTCLRVVDSPPFPSSSTLTRQFPSPVILPLKYLLNSSSHLQRTLTGPQFCLPSNWFSALLSEGAYTGRKLSEVQI